MSQLWLIDPFHGLGSSGEVPDLWAWTPLWKKLGLGILSWF